MAPVARRLHNGTRLHLQHGPIDLIIGADGQREVAFNAATERFATVLVELVAELPDLRSRLFANSPQPDGQIAQRMHKASLPFVDKTYVSRMAAVAGAVADEVLAAMVEAAQPTRAFVNNGGDIALHLTEGASLTTAIQAPDGQSLGRVTLDSGMKARGIATSGRHGRSLSLGIADSVTVLARSAADADVAATLIANAVDLPDHPAITRRAACALVEDSDLGDLPVVTGCGALSPTDCNTALAAGATTTRAFEAAGLISGAALFLQGRAITTGIDSNTIQIQELMDA